MAESINKKKYKEEVLIFFINAMAKYVNEIKYLIYYPCFQTGLIYTSFQKISKGTSVLII